jgi:hypothetical protein
MAKAIADVLRARRIELVDTAGVARATLSVVPNDEGGIVVLGLCSPEGVEHLTLSCDEESASLTLWERGNVVLWAASYRDGFAALTLAEHGRFGDPEGGG